MSCCEPVPWSTFETENRSEDQDHCLNESELSVWMKVTLEHDKRQDVTSYLSSETNDVVDGDDELDE